MGSWGLHPMASALTTPTAGSARRRKGRSVRRFGRFEVFFLGLVELSVALSEVSEVVKMAASRNSARARGPSGWLVPT